MTIHEFGKENKETIILIHPSVVKWDYFENVIPLLEKNYHLLVPALPGYDFDNDNDFTSVEQIASDLNNWIKAKGFTEIYAVYGCSMGGSVALMVALGQKVRIQHCVIDGGITPYQLPWIVTRFIALKDYLMMMIGRAGGVALLEKAFATDDYSKEDLQYVADVLRHCSSILYSLQHQITVCVTRIFRRPQLLHIHYWYAKNEEKERKNDIAYIRRRLPQTEFEVLPELGHGGLVLLRPELFEEMMSKFQ